MCDARDKPLPKDNHTDSLSYIEAGTDRAEDIEHLSPYAEDAVFKGPTGAVLAQSMNKVGGFWVQK